MVLFVGVVIAFLSLSPTLMLFYGSFRSKPLGVPSDFSLAHYINAYTDPLTYELLFNSFLFATGSALLATALAATLAWISIRTNAPLRKFSSSRPSCRISFRRSCWRCRGRCC